MIFNVESAHQRHDAFVKFATRDRLDGLIVISLPVSDADVATLRRQELPTVLVDVDHRELSAVTIDNVAGGELATRASARRGHTRIAFIGDAPTARSATRRATRAIRDISARCAAAGVGARSRAGVASAATTLDPAVGRGPHSRVDAREAVVGCSRPLARQPPCSPPRTCRPIGALQAAAATGLRVPGDLAVIGFDDTETAEIVALTTVRQPLEESGAEGMGMLLAELAGDGDRRRRSRCRSQ